MKAIDKLQELWYGTHEWKVRYKFLPDEDITAYELALIREAGPYQDRQENLPRECRRHFMVVKVLDRIESHNSYDERVLRRWS